MMAEQFVLQPALDAFEELKSDVLDRVGQQGGNLNRRMKANLNTIGLALNTFSSIVAQHNTVAQQTQIISKMTNDLSKDMTRLLKAGSFTNGEDDGTSETKGH